MFWTVVLAIVIIAGLVIREQIAPISRKWHNIGRTKLPRGPSGLPLVGNLLQFQRARREGAMKSYLLAMRNYGDMTTLQMGSQLWVLLNTDQVARDLIGKSSSITSERPYMPVASGLVSGDKRTVLQRTHLWDEPRRLMRQLMTSPFARAFEKWQDDESVRMLTAYLREPEKWYLHQARYATGFLYGVVTGSRLTKTDDELATYRQVTAEFLGSLFTSIVDFFPILANLPIPLQIWRPYWQRRGDFHRRAFESWWDPIRKTAEQNSANWSWVRDVVLNKATPFNGDSENAMYLTNSVISAGGDNTRMTLNTFVMAIVCYPEIIHKCRAEIDAVCGVSPERLPRIEDISSMPYMCAVIKEVLRWRPIVPLVPPHQLTEELEYGGFLFPKGTNFLINTTAICADCNQPDEFLPERWLDGNEASLTHGFWGFGGGRRICIGYKVEQTALFLAMSRLIYCFNFESIGNPDSQSLQYGPFDAMVEHLPLVVRKRSSLHEILIINEGLARSFYK